MNGPTVNQLVERIPDFHDFVVGGFDSRHMFHHVFDLGPIATGGYEGYVIFAQELRHQTPRKTAGSVNYHRTLSRHGSPSR